MDALLLLTLLLPWNQRRLIDWEIQGRVPSLNQSEGSVETQRGNVDHESTTHPPCNSGTFMRKRDTNTHGLSFGNIGIFFILQINSFSLWFLWNSLSQLTSIYTSVNEGRLIDKSQCLSVNMGLMMMRMMEKNMSERRMNFIQSWRDGMGSYIQYKNMDGMGGEFRRRDSCVGRIWPWGPMDSRNLARGVGIWGLLPCKAKID